MTELSVQIDGELEEAFDEYLQRQIHDITVNCSGESDIVRTALTEFLEEELDREIDT